MRPTLRLCLLAILLGGCGQPFYYCRVRDSTLVAPNSGSASLCAAASSADEVCKELMSSGLGDTVTGRAGPYDNRENCEVSGPLDFFRPGDAGSR
jgi:hypothetical protein